METAVMDVHKRNSSSSFKCPLGSLRLFDLIKPSENSYSPAFYFALRDTLVAENIDEATKIAFSGKTRYRVASLNGEIIEKNGTITCGGQPIRGRMLLNSERRFSLEKSQLNLNPSVLLQEIEVLSQKQSDILNEISQLDMNINETRTSMEDLEKNIEKIPKEIVLHEQEAKSLVSIRGKIEKEYSNCLPDQNELHKTQMNLEQQKKEKEKAQTNYDVVEQQIKKINQQIS
ncbi:hypothetical protein MXB_4529, partial [Myxobolus squamalis]